MLKAIYIFVTLTLLALNSNSQITKNNWLLSGNASFSTQKSSSTASLQYKQTDFQISPTIGYFIIDKFAVGLRPSFTYGKINWVANAKSQTIFSIGPFARYYFLQTDTSRRRLSGVIFKPLYAAIIGNNIVVSDKEKREQRFL